MDRDQVLAFRLARCGLAGAVPGSLPEAVSCPASDFSRDAALLALAARMPDVSREAYDGAVDSGELVVAHVIRGAIHALAPGDLGLYGRALIATDDAELGAQLGRQVQGLAAEHGFAPTEALSEVSGAVRDALGASRGLDRTQLHEALRQRVRADLLPWCRGCGSHHVAPMLWRYATVQAGARLDAERRYRLADPGPVPAAGEAVRRFLRFYGPSSPGEFGEWAGVSRPHARRLWSEVERGLVEVPGPGAPKWLLREDAPVLESPPAITGIRLLPPGDPCLQKPNRPLLAPDPQLRGRLFRPVASPGAVLRDGRLAGLWRVRAKGRRAHVAVEALEPLVRAQLEAPVRRLASLRGAQDFVLDLD